MVEHIPNMAHLAKNMVKQSIEAFHQHDLKKALEVKNWKMIWMDYLKKLR